MKRNCGRGFFTIRGGHRVGLAGKAVLEDGKIRTVRSISFLNIRLAHQIRGLRGTGFSLPVRRRTDPEYAGGLAAGMRQDHSSAGYDPDGV